MEKSEKVEKGENSQLKVKEFQENEERKVKVRKFKQVSENKHFPILTFNLIFDQSAISRSQANFSGVRQKPRKIKSRIYYGIHLFFFVTICIAWSFRF